MGKSKKLQPASTLNIQIKYLIGLLVLTFILYIPSLKNEFNNWDDNAYILSNPNIELSKENIKKSFTQGEYHRMYVPLTALSHSIVYHYYKLNPKPYIFINLLIHLFNIILVFVFISLLIKKPYVPLLVAALFALHPMQVESVAYAAGRRDVLYVFFYLLCLIFYIKSLDRKQPYLLKYILSVIFALMAMLSKGQALAIPATLILISFFYDIKWTTKSFWLDKIPFIILAVIVAYKVFVAPQYASGSFTNSSYLDTNIPFFNRIIYACSGFVQYIILLLIPYKLALVHPYPFLAGKLMIPTSYYLYFIVFAVIIFLFFKYAVKEKHRWFGLAFFAINIFMMLQLLPNSYGIMNDHYVYFAGIGVFLFICKIAADKFLAKKNAYLFYVFFGLYAILLCSLSYQRIQVFSNSKTVWTDVIEKYPDCELAYNNRGYAYYQLGFFDQAVVDYNKAINIKPDFALAYNNRGYAFYKLGFFNKAIIDYNQAIIIKPDYALAYNNRGIAKQYIGLIDEAIMDYTKAVESNPVYDWAYYNRGILYASKGLIDKAINDNTKAIECNPAFADAYNNRGMGYLAKGYRDKACIDFNKARELGSKFALDNINKFCN